MLFRHRERSSPTGAAGACPTSATLDQPRALAAQDRNTHATRRAVAGSAQSTGTGSVPGGQAFSQPQAQETGEPCLSPRPSPTCWAGLTVLTRWWLCPASSWVSHQPPAVPCSVPAQSLASVLCLHQHLRYRLSLQKLTSRPHTGASGGGCDKQEAQTQPAPGVCIPAWLILGRRPPLERHFGP